MYITSYYFVILLICKKINKLWFDLFTRLIIMCRQKIYYNYIFMSFLYLITIFNSVSDFVHISAFVSSITIIICGCKNISEQRYYVGFKYFHPSGTLWNATESVKVIKIRIGTLTCIIMRYGARDKKGHQLTGRYSKTWEWWVLFQTNRSKQGRLVRHLPPLKGTTCLLLFHLPASPGTLSEDLNVTIYILFLYPVLPYPLTLLLEYNIQHTLEITDVSCRVHW